MILEQLPAEINSLFFSFQSVLSVTGFHKANWCAVYCLVEGVSMAHAWPGAAWWKETPIRPPSANKCIILAVSTIQHYTSLLAPEGHLRPITCVCACVRLCVYITFVVTAVPHPAPTPSIHQHANLHPGRNRVFRSYIITCIRLIARDGALQSGTGEPAWLTLGWEGSRWMTGLVTEWG